MIVISDTTPLISILKNNRLDLLKLLFDIVVIPNGVFHELVDNEDFKTESETIKNCDFIKVVQIQNQDDVDLLRNQTGLDLGESEAISYSKSTNSDLLLMDEIKGRLVAKRLGLTIMGTVGILKTAYEMKFITKADIKNYIEILKQNHRHISQKLFDDLLASI